MGDMFHLVLFEPEIPPNTGNVIRLCANTGAELHLIKPLGFDLDKPAVRRAGLDYRWMTQVHVHADFAAVRRQLPGRWFAIETGGSRRYDQVVYQPGDVLLFGSEGRGLPTEILTEIGQENWLSIPMRVGNRSLNLSNSVTLVTYEAWRQNDFAMPRDQTPP